MFLQAEFECVNPKKLKKKNYKNSGVVSIKKCEVMIRYMIRSDDI